MEFIWAPSEAIDEIITFPNPHTIRGTRYRDPSNRIQAGPER
jgi:hypothetical protein